MITIEQLLESVDLEFEPRWVTKNPYGIITIWDSEPQKIYNTWAGVGVDRKVYSRDFGELKLAEFDGKDWTECIYEVPRKTAGKIEKLDEHAGNMQLSSASMTRNQFVANTIMKKINELVDAVNEFKGAKNVS